MNVRCAVVAIALIALTTGCSRPNNLLLGRVEATAAGHRVVVTDCYRVQVDPPVVRSSVDWSFAPCRDSVIVVRADELTVNGRSYGPITPRSQIVVDHGVVSISPGGLSTN